MNHECFFHLSDTQQHLDRVETSQVFIRRCLDGHQNRLSQLPRHSSTLLWTDLCVIHSGVGQGRVCLNTTPETQHVIIFGAMVWRDGCCMRAWHHSWPRITLVLLKCHCVNVLMYQKLEIIVEVEYAHLCSSYNYNIKNSNCTMIFG